MLALIKEGKGNRNIVLKEIDVPQISDDELLVEVKSAGLCGTDLHVVNDEYPSRLPVVLGHEFSGMVKKVGNNIKDIKVGQRVSSEPFYKTCGNCYLCNSGNYNLCDEKIALGSKANGAFAQFVKINKNRVHLIPDDVSYEEGSLFEPLACSVHGVNEILDVRHEDLVVVFGTGPIGMISAKLAQICGAKVVLCGTRYSIRTEVAKNKFNINYVLNIKDIDIYDFFKNKLEDKRVDTVIECSGSEEAVNSALNIVKKRGIFLQIGLFSKKILVDFGKVSSKELRVYGSFGSNYNSWNKALEILKSKRINLGSLITHKFSLRDWKKAFDTLEKGKGIKIIFNEFN